MKIPDFKYSIIKLFKLLVFLLLVVDINFSILETDTTIQAGINGKHLQKSWKFLKGCMGIGDDVLKKNLDDITRIKSKLVTTPLNVEIVKFFDVSVDCVDDILPQINESLSKSISENSSSQKIIKCLKLDADQTRMALFENNTLKLNKLIKNSFQKIYLNEYDVYQMEEFSYVGTDGLEWMIFRIPRKAEYLLNGKFKGRVFECMVFNLPKDTSGRWEQMRAFLIDLFTRPGQLWDEYLFYKELERLNLNKQEVYELREYMFAHLNNPKYDFQESIRKKTIA